MSSPAPTSSFLRNYSNSIASIVESTSREEQLEIEALERELQYILKNEVPQQWKLILQELTKLVEWLGGPRESNVEEVMIPTEQVKFEVEDAAKGYVDIEGYHIVSGKINLRLARFNKGATIETSISATEPYTLQQLQKSHHLAENAIIQLQKIDVEKLDKNTVHSLIVVLEEVMAILQQSREQVSMATSLASTFPGTPQNYTTETIKQLQQSFYPVLPEDIVVEFTIDDAKLLISVYGLTNAANNMSAGSVRMLESPIVISSANTGEIVSVISEKHTTVKELTSLKNGLQHLVSAFKMCVRLRDKLVIHRQILATTSGMHSGK